FRGCLHVKEPKCAVKDAVESGEIEASRYEHYLQFLQEIIDRKPRY
ncbi:MAG: ribosome small subunit-dependent GTPase A, partial [Kurthia sp.]|nr:ribosome small subunit-dependent GTPase A [Kurthia sp.]